MGFLIEIFWALLMVGLPVSIFTTVLVYWTLQRGQFEESLDMKGLGQKLKAMSKANKKKDKQDPEESTENVHPLQKKWAKFGGGFYGIVAFFTYIVVEVREVFDMIMEFGGLFDFLKQLNFGVIIEFFVEALTNFITAMIWPVYWMQRIDTNQTWIWFVMAYAGYWSGLKVAQVLSQRHAGSAQ